MKVYHIIFDEAETSHTRIVMSATMQLLIFQTSTKHGLRDINNKCLNRSGDIGA